MRSAMIQLRVSPEEKMAYEKALTLDHSRSLGDFLRRAANDRLRLLMGKEPEPMVQPWQEFLAKMDDLPKVKGTPEMLDLIDAAEERLKQGKMKTISGDEAKKLLKKLIKD